MPETWRTVSLDIEGYVLPHTIINEEYLALKRIQKLINAGHTEKEIALIWNGHNNWQCIKGVNKYGVKYDSCAYVQKVVRALSN